MTLDGVIDLVCLLRAMSAKLCLCGLGGAIGALCFFHQKCLCMSLSGMFGFVYFSRAMPAESASVWPWAVCVICAVRPLKVCPLKGVVEAACL